MSNHFSLLILLFFVKIYKISPFFIFYFFKKGESKIFGDTSFLLSFFLKKKGPFNKKLSKIKRNFFFLRYQHYKK
jgi:hypothetical protein